MAPEKSPEKRIALTGATGFVGGWIMRAALESGYKVTALTRRPVETIEGVRWVSGDLENEASLARLLDDADAFIHTAGLVKARSERDFFAVNAGAVKRIVDLGTKAKKGTDFHFVLISSLAARHPGLSPYAESKRAGEEVLMTCKAGFPCSIIRPPAVYGPGDREILKLFRTMQKGFAPAAGDDDNVFSLIHVRDLAASILAVLHQAGTFGEILEPDDQKKAGYNMKEVAKTAEAVLGRRVRTLEVPGPVLHLFAAANEMVARFGREPAILSAGKVREMTHPNWLSDQSTHKRIPDWGPEITLLEGFSETVSWYRENKLL